MAVPFGGVPRLPAHEVGNPMFRKRDRDAEACRPKVPPVPRAPRAKPRANSCGALARSLAKSNDTLRSSEQRQPRQESPFAHARVNLLHRERECPDNQVFEMGPRSCSADRTEFLRGGGRLNADSKPNQGMPWTVPKEEDDLPQRVPARRHTLKHERKAADQALEWVPTAALGSRPTSSESRSHARVNTFSRELGHAQQSLEISPAVQAATAQILTGTHNCHGRINVLKREQAKLDAYVEAPRALDVDSDVPVYGRRTMLARENPVGFAPSVAAH